MELLTWLGIGVCLAQSAMFSGLTLGFFGLSRLRLEVQATAGNTDARKILSLRRDSHFLLATLLWGNVGVNVLLTLLSESVLAGVAAFVFSTAGITCLGELAPQAYMARHALRAGAVLVPVVRLYQMALFPVAKPTAWLLDLWLGREDPQYFREEELKVLLRHHAMAGTADISQMESIGAVNFLSLDDVLVEEEGEVVDPESIIQLPVENGRPVFPTFRKDAQDVFLQEVQDSRKKWVILVDLSNTPLLVLDADQFLRDVVYEPERTNPYMYCHRPIVVTEPGTRLGAVIRKFRVQAEHAQDDVVDHDLILYWGEQKRVITGADLLGRLLRDIVHRQRKEPSGRSLG